MEYVIGASPSTSFALSVTTVVVFSATLKFVDVEKLGASFTALIVKLTVVVELFTSPSDIL